MLTWVPVSGAPMPYLGRDNTWTMPGATPTGGGGGSSGGGGGGEEAVEEVTEAGEEVVMEEVVVVEVQAQPHPSPGRQRIQA